MITRLNLFLITLLIAISTCAQDTVWISRTGSVIPTKDSAVSYQLIFRSSTDTSQVKVLKYDISGTIQEENNYSPYYKKVLHGASREYRNGKLKEEREYENNQVNGFHKTYWEHGKLKRNDLYENGKFVNGNCYGFDGTDTTWFEYSQPATFPGGIDSLIKFLRLNLRYPPYAKQSGIQGTVHVLFYVNKEGMPEEMKVKKSVDPLLDREAIRLTSIMPAWIPGKIDGRPAKFSYALPITFRLDD